MSILDLILGVCIGVTIKALAQRWDRRRAFVLEMERQRTIRIASENRRKAEEYAANARLTQTVYELQMAVNAEQAARRVKIERLEPCEN